LVPVSPVRAIDTRNASSGANLYTESVDGSTPVVNVPLAGLYGLPAGVNIVCVMVTAIAPLGPESGFVVVHGNGTPVPATSNVNTSGGVDARPNLVVVAMGADGSINLRLDTVADVLVDVIGTFTDGSAPSLAEGTYELVGPSRVVDTRSSFGLPRFSAGATGTIDPSVVPTGAVAISQNVVITNTATAGFLTTYPAGLAQLPVVSNGNASGPNQTRSVLSFTRMGTTSVSYYTDIATDVIVDITGYFNG
jgi:hypothetical protein